MREHQDNIKQETNGHHSLRCAFMVLLLVAIRCLVAYINRFQHVRGRNSILIFPLLDVG